MRLATVAWRASTSPMRRRLPVDEAAFVVVLHVAGAAAGGEGSAATTNECARLSIAASLARLDAGQLRRVLHGRAAVGGT